MSGEYHKGAGQGKGLTRQGDLPLLHGFKKCGLNLGRCPVHLVGKDEVSEDRPLPQRPIPGLGVVDLGAQKVRGQKVRGELDASKAAAHGPRNRLDGEGLGEARHAFQQDMAVGQESDEQASDQGFLPHDHAFHFLDDIAQEAAFLFDALGKGCQVLHVVLALCIRMRCGEARREGMSIPAKGSRNNKFTVLVPRFGSDLAAQIECNRRRSHSSVEAPVLFDGRLRRGRRWPEDEMRDGKLFLRGP